MGGRVRAEGWGGGLGEDGGYDGKGKGATLDGWMGGGDFFSGYVMKREGSLRQEETGWWTDSQGRQMDMDRWIFF